MKDKFQIGKWFILLALIALGIGIAIIIKQPSKNPSLPKPQLAAAAQTGCDTVICPSAWQWMNTDNFYIGMTLYNMYKKGSASGGGCCPATNDSLGKIIDTLTKANNLLRKGLYDYFFDAGEPAIPELNNNLTNLILNNPWQSGFVETQYVIADTVPKPSVDTTYLLAGGVNNVFVTDISITLLVPPSSTVIAYLNAGSAVIFSFAVAGGSALTVQTEHMTFNSPVRFTGSTPLTFHLKGLAATSHMVTIKAYKIF